MFARKSISGTLPLPFSRFILQFELFSSHHFWFECFFPLLGYAELRLDMIRLVGRRRKEVLVLSELICNPHNHQDYINHLINTMQL